MKIFKTQVSGCPIKSNLDKTLDELERSWEVFGWASACKFGGVAQSHTCKYQGLVKSDTNRTSGWHWQFLFVQLRAASFTTRHTHHWSEGSLLGKVVGNMISQRRVDWFCVHFIETHPFMLFWERPKINKHKCMIPAPKWMPSFENIFKKRMLLYSTIWALIFLLQKKQDRYIRR